MSLYEETTCGVDFSLINEKRRLLKSYLDIPITRGMLRLQDLMPKFLDVAEKITKLLYLKDKNLTVLSLREEWQDVVGIKNFGSGKSWLISDELETLLNDLAPEGYYFGSRSGDDDCFGFWKTG